MPQRSQPPGWLVVLGVVVGALCMGVFLVVCLTLWCMNVATNIMRLSAAPVTRRLK